MRKLPAFVVANIADEPRQRQLRASKSDAHAVLK